MKVHTYCGALAFSVNGVHCCHNKHKPEKKCEEENGVEEHPVRKPPRPNFHFDEFSNSLPWKHSHMPQAG